MIEDIKNDEEAVAILIPHRRKKAFATWNQSQVKYVVMSLHDKTVEDFGVLVAPVVVDRYCPTDDLLDLVVSVRIGVVECRSEIKDRAMVNLLQKAFPD